MQKITIELTLNDWNYVLNVLGRQPYVEVQAILAALQEQAKAQLVEQPSEIK